MGKILFLDDMEERHKEFQRVCRGAGRDIVPVWTASAAIDQLCTEKFDQVFLDHDLSHDDIMVKVGEKSVVPTGMTVVDYILTMEDPPPDVIIHSCNGPAATEMEARLNQHPAKIRVRRHAFPFLMKQLRENQ